MDLQSVQNNIYTVLVAGNSDLSKYDLSKTVEPYVVYYYDKRKSIKEQAIKIYRDFILKLDDEPANLMLKELLNLKLQDIEEMSDEEYFETATKGMTYDSSGNALTTLNPNGKYSRIELPTLKTAIPLKDNSFKCYVSDLPEIKIDKKNADIYGKQWDGFMKQNGSVKNNYINMYGTKDRYVKVMTEPLFYNAFLSDEIGWLEQCDENQVEWVLNFRERFIKKLPQDTLLTVYNYVK